MVRRRTLVPPHRSTTRALRAMFPSAVSERPYFGGILHGIDRFGRPVYFEDNLLVANSIIPSSGKVTVGKTGDRKSGSVKLEVLRSQGLMRAGLPMSTLIFSRKKDEYRRLVEVCGGTLIDFSQGDDGRPVCINLLDIAMMGGVSPETIKEALPRLESLVVKVLTQLRKAPITGLEQDGLRIGLRKTIQETLDDPVNFKQPVLSRLNYHIARPSQGDADDLDDDTTVDDLRRDTRELRALIRRLTEGDASGFLDGATNLDLRIKKNRHGVIDLDHRMTNNLRVFDFSQIREDMRGIVIGVIIEQYQAAWDRGDPEYTVHKVIYEECWDYFRYLQFGEGARQGQKLQRVGAIDYHYIMHNLGDPNAAGADGSVEVKLAQGLLSDTHIRRVFGVDKSQIDKIETVFDLNGAECDVVLGFDPGWSLVKFGPYSIVLNNYTPDPFEKQVVYTNAAVDAAAE